MLRKRKDCTYSSQSLQSCTGSQAGETLPEAGRVTEAQYWEDMLVPISIRCSKDHRRRPPGAAPVWWGCKDIPAFPLTMTPGMQPHCSHPAVRPPFPLDLASTSLWPGRSCHSNVTAQGLPSPLLLKTHLWLSLSQPFWFILPSVKYFFHEH